MTHVTTGFEPVQHAFDGFCAADPSYSAQLSVRVRGDVVVDLVGPTGLQADSLLPVYSTSKGATAVVIALLVERGQLDLDARVADHWPEFAAAGKAAVTVRQLLSHQAGLLGVDDGFTWEEVLDHTALAERLAAQRPFWRPGAGFQYHALTIGTLADELVRRIDGRTVATVLREDVTGPRGIDVWMGTPASQDHRVVDAQLPNAEELVRFLTASPRPLAGDPDGIGNVSMPPGDPTALVQRVNEEVSRRAGAPAAGMLASATGLAALYASLRHEVGGPRLLSDDTLAQMAQIQVDGVELGSGLPSRFGVIFQAPCPRWPFGSHRAFGHDGAGGSLAFCDPAYDVAFGYTVQRLPLPGGMDARAVELTRIVRDCC